MILNSHPICDPQFLKRRDSETDTQLNGIVSSVSNLRFFIQKEFFPCVSKHIFLKLIRKGGVMAFDGNPARRSERMKRLLFTQDPSPYNILEFPCELK